MFDAVLFDLDGTLADTAPDLGWAANALREAEGLVPLPLATLRPWTSQGVRGLLRIAFDIAPGDSAYDELALRFTDPLVAQLGLTPRTPCVVSGDTTAEAKPSPLPILHACQLLNCRPERTLYVGDDRRDIVAGNAAGCKTVAAAYGYLGDSGPIPVWGADLLIESPMALAGYLNRNLASG